MALPVPLYGFVVEEEKRFPKKDGGRPWWQVTLKTTLGSIKSFVWDIPADVESNPNYPHVGDILKVINFEDKLEEFKNITIKDFLKIKKEDLPADQKEICEVPRASKEEIETSLKMIQDSSFWDDVNNHKFMLACLKKLNFQKFLDSPAAAKVHHAYAGGLIVHTAEVLNLCRVIADTMTSRYTFFSRDVLFCSAILHDIGKTDTYFIDEIGMAKSLPNEKTIGHIVFGMMIIKSVADELKYNPAFVEEVLHCIAAHHGNVSYGSIKEVQSIEAGILSRSDYMSSRNGLMEQVLDEYVKTKQPIPDQFEIYKDNYFSTTGMKKYVEENTNDSKSNSL